MRIDLVITELDVGGAEKMMAALAQHLHRRHSVRLIALGPTPTADRNRLLRELQAKGIEPHFLAGRGFASAYQTFRKLSRLIAEDRPDVALSFLFHANVIATYCYANHSVPIAVSVRVADRSFWRAFVSRHVYQKCHKILCVSSGVAQHVQSYEHAGVHKIEVIPNGIDIDSFLRQSDLIPDDWLAVTQSLRSPRYLLFVGRMVPQKQLEWLVSLVQNHHQKFPQSVIFIGDGMQQQLIRQLAVQFPDRVAHLGRRNDIPAWIGRCDLMLLPSAYEGMANVALEAMAAGKPILATRVEGMSELLGDELDAQTSSVTDMAHWHNQVIRLANDAALREEIGCANQTRCRQHFQLAQLLDQYEKTLVTIAARTSSGRNTFGIDSNTL